MSVQFLMGNEAIALGAIYAGVSFVSGYPGTPSTEVLETVAKKRPEDVYVEWSTNEKAALEVAAGAAYCGARTMVTMKQVGLNVASDPLMSLAYVGVKGGMVIMVADDPGPISSQTEQDTRTFARFSKLPIFDPSTPDEAFLMIQDAFDYSEKYGTPVIFRPTTRVCHACASIDIPENPKMPVKGNGFTKDTLRWVIFPKTSYLNHIKIEKRYSTLGDEFSTYRFNKVSGTGKKGIACCGVSRCYVKQALEGRESQYKLFELATVYPFPERLAVDFLRSVDEVLCFEELDPVVERELIFLCGKYKLKVKICGKLDLCAPQAGEYSSEIASDMLDTYFGTKRVKLHLYDDAPELPIRPPVLCAGCPHRASFYAVKQATKGRKAVYCGDIGCYTLANAKPLDMCDTCLCMGADVTIAQGIKRMEPDTLCFSFIGDSTFFASGITGIINAVYNKADIILVILDNATTAMTGHQPHPGTGVTMMGESHEPVKISKILEAIGLTSIRTVDPLELSAAVNAVSDATNETGVRAVIFKSPCIAVTKPTGRCTVDDERCIGCKMCIRELGCPAISVENGCVRIEPSLCTGCGLCTQVCPVGAINVTGGTRL